MVGSRMAGAQSELPTVRRLGNRLFAGLVTVISGQRVTDSASGMRIFRRDIFERLYPLPDGLNLTPVMSTRALLADAINENVLASGLVVLLPLGVGGVAWVLRRERNRVLRWLMAGATLLALALASFVLFLTRSRGGWLGLGVGAVCGGWLVVRQRFRLRPYGQLDGRAWWLGQVGTPEQIEGFREARKRLAPG